MRKELIIIFLAGILILSAFVVNAANENVKTKEISIEISKPTIIEKDQYVSINIDEASSVIQNEWLLDPEYDAMLEDAIQTVDKEERFAKYNRLQHLIVDLCPTIFLCDQTVRRPFQSSYVDWYIDEDFSPVMGYDFVVRYIKVYPEKRAELLK